MIIEIGIGFICTGLIIFLIRLPDILKKPKDKKESERIEEERIRNLKRTIIENIPEEETKHIEEIEKPKEEVEKESDDIIPIPKRFLDLVGTIEEFTGYLFSEEEEFENFTPFMVLEARWGNIEVYDEKTMNIHPTVVYFLKEKMEKELNGLQDFL